MKAMTQHLKLTKRLFSSSGSQTIINIYHMWYSPYFWRFVKVQLVLTFRNSSAFRTAIPQNSYLKISDWQALILRKPRIFYCCFCLKIALTIFQVTVLVPIKLFSRLVQVARKLEDLSALPYTRLLDAFLLHFLVLINLRISWSKVVKCRLLTFYQSFC